MNRTDRPSVRLSVTSLYDKFIPPSVIYNNPDYNMYYKKKDSIESKVDGKPPFSMLIMTPYMVQIKFSQISIDF
jgi:hypothetical protein